MCPLCACDRTETEKFFTRYMITNEICNNQHVMRNKCPEWFHSLINHRLQITYHISTVPYIISGHFRMWRMHKNSKIKYDHKIVKLDKRQQIILSKLDLITTCYGLTQASRIILFFIFILGISNCNHIKHITWSFFFCRAVSCCGEISMELVIFGSRLEIVHSLSSSFIFFPFFFFFFLSIFSCPGYLVLIRWHQEIEL